jgi:glucose uptake protein
MILPQNYVQCLLIMILGTLCLGSWAATYRASGKWRFELYYVDFAIGAGIAALIYAFTVGNLGFDGFSVLDDLMHAAKRQLLFAFTAGVIFNLGNMLIVGAISVAGMAVAMTLGAGLGILVGIGISQLTRAGTNQAMMGGSLFLMVAAIASMTVAYAMIVADRRGAAAAEQTGKRRRPQPGVAKGIVPALIGGLLMGATFPVFGRSQGGEFGLGPYSAVTLFAVGLVASTFVYSMFFMNLPIQGEPVEVLDYVRAGGKTHFLGLLGGILWCTGFLTVFVALACPPEIQPNRFLAYALLQAGPLLAAIWGLAVFREFRTSTRGAVYALLALVLSGSSLALTLLSYPRA